MHKLFDLLEEPITKEQLVKEEKLDEDATIYKIAKPKSKINSAQLILLIPIYYDAYYNTDQNIEIFAKEFYYVLGELYDGYIVLESKYLAVDKIYTKIYDVLMEDLK